MKRMVLNLAVKWFFLILAMMLLMAVVAHGGQTYTLQSNGYYSNNTGQLFIRKKVRYYQNGCWREYYRYDPYTPPAPVIKQEVTINQVQEVKSPPPKGWRDKILDAHLKDIEHLQAIEKSDLEHQQYMEALESLNKIKGEFQQQQQEQQQPYSYNVKQYSSEYPAYGQQTQSLVNPLQDTFELISSFGAYSRQQLEVTEKIGTKFGQITEDSVSASQKQAELLNQVQAYKEFLQAMKDNTVREVETEITAVPTVPVTPTQTPQPTQPSQPSETLPKSNLIVKAEQILEDRCTYCHKGAEAPKGLSFEDGLSSVPSEKVLDFIARLRTEDSKKAMPPPNEGEPLSFDQILTLELAIKETLR